MYGTILTVEVQHQGVVARSWSTAQVEATEETPAHYPMEVDNAVDLDPEGGLLQLPDGTQVPYLGFTEGGEEGVDPEEVYDDAPDLVWVAAPGPEGGLTDDLVLNCWPLAPETVAQVQIYETDEALVEAVVAHALRPQLPEGPRDPGDAEAVVVGLVGGQLTVTEVLGRASQVRHDKVEGLDEALDDLHSRLDTSAEALEEAKTDLDQRTKANEEALMDPALAAKVAALVGDFADLFATKITASMLNVDQAMAQKLQAVIATFQQVFADTIVADMIKLDTLAGKVLNGVDIYSPHVDSFPQVHIGGSVIETKRQVTEEDGAKRAVTGISLGGDTDDKMQLLNSDGSVLAGFDADGSGRSSDFAAEGDISATGKVTADAADFGELSVGPHPDLAAVLNNLPRGLIARQKLGTTASGNNVKFGSSWLGYYELYFDSAKDRAQRVTYDGLVYCSGPGTYNFSMGATSKPGYTETPVSPNADGTRGVQVAIGRVNATSAGFYPLYMQAWFGDYGGTYRVLLSAQAPSGQNGYLVGNDNWPGWFYAEDMGAYLGQADGGYNRGGGAPYTGSPTVTETVPVIVKKTFTSTWNASGVATYRAGVGSMSTSQYKLQQGTYGGANRWSHAVFNGGAVSGEKGKTIAQALSGATVSKVEFYGLVKDTYWGSSGTAVLAPATQTALTSIPTSNAESRFGQWKAGTAKWVTLYNPLGTSVRSVAIGPDSAGTVEYIKFDPTLAKLKLRITYTR